MARSLLLVGLLLTGCGEEAESTGSTVIANAIVIDGTGAPPRSASVRIAGDRIVEVGNLEASPRDSILDADRLILAPGFVDTHSHADEQIFEHPDALAAVSQGITTVIVGQDGKSIHPLREFFSRLEREGVTVNVASYAGFGTLREKVLREDFRRPATSAEIERMRALLRVELEAGALGLATGLEYDPGIYSSPDEVLALARETAAHRGRYISHIRSEDRHFWEAIDEIVRIGREAALPVQVSHVKLALRRNHGEAERLIRMLDSARAAGVDITADIYPYAYWESYLTVLFPERDFESLETARYALSEVTTPDAACLGKFDPDPTHVGKTLREVGQMRGVDAPTALIELIRESEAYQERTGEEEVDSLIATSMREPDIERLMRWPHTNLCTDGELAGPHPRGFGSYPRFLGRYVRERRIMDLATAVHKSSGLAAAHMGIRDRGVIRPGAMADLVLFDASTVLDRATPEEPHALSVGVQTVWVNGDIVYENGRTTGRRPGRVIRRQVTGDSG